MGSRYDALDKQADKLDLQIAELKQTLEWVHNNNCSTVVDVLRVALKRVKENKERFHKRHGIIA